MSTLYELTTQFQELLELIQNEEYDEQVLADTMEGLDGEIEIKADGYARVIRELEGNVLTIKSEVDRLNKKKKSFESSINRMKDKLEESMKATGKVKFKTDLFSFNIQKNPARLVVTGDVPEEYLIPQEPKIDNAAIRKLLKEQDLDYAHLEQGESLRIR